MRNKEMSQNTQIMAYLKKYGSISPLEALETINCWRLAGRISEIRSGLKGSLRVKTVMVEKNGKHYAEYRLVRS